MIPRSSSRFEGQDWKGRKETSDSQNRVVLALQNLRYGRVDAQIDNGAHKQTRPRKATRGSGGVGGRGEIGRSPKGRKRGGIVFMNHREGVWESRGEGGGSARCYAGEWGSRIRDVGICQRRKQRIPHKEPNRNKLSERRQPYKAA